MELTFFYILPLIINWAFLFFGRDEGNKNSAFVIFIVSLIPIVNIFGAIMSFSVVANKKY